MGNKRRNSTTVPFLSPCPGLASLIQPWALFPEWNRKMGNGTCHQSKTAPLCWSFLIVLFPWSCLGPSQALVLHKLLKQESFPWTPGLQNNPAPMLVLLGLSCISTILLIRALWFFVKVLAFCKKPTLNQKIKASNLSSIPERIVYSITFVNIYFVSVT